MKEKKEPEFEEALERLEAIITAMESDETPLTELVTKFEEGNKLLRLCEQKLKHAELKIERLKREKETPVYEDFHPEKEH